MQKVRMSIEVSKEVADFLEELSKEEGASKTEIIRRSLSVMKAYKSQKSVGRNHIGFTADPQKLDAEIVGILDN